MKKGISGAILTLGLILLTASSAPLWGQAVANAQISGIVTDSSGAAVPNVKINATQTDTGQVRTTVSGPDGTYVFPDLPVGPYKLEAQLSGFNGYVQNGILLEVSNNISINIALKVGEVMQQVEVTANANMVQTQTTSVAQVMDQTRILELPLNGRQATDLILLAGAASNNGPANGAYFNDLQSSKNYFSAVNISVAGGQANGTNYLLDGGVHMDAFSDINLPFPFPDALQEFSVQTSTLSARYGVHGGAVVNVLTKSGTNQFHGDAFEFVRNGDFNARDFFAASQDSLKRNQFGGTIGGPVLKDKLFGFFGYQGTRIRTAPGSYISHVPTQAALNGDFSQLESAACQSGGTPKTIINPATSQPFQNSFVDPSTFNQVALNMLKYVPVSSDPCGELTYAIPEPQGENQYIGRLDWIQSSKHTLFGRYFYTDYKSPAIFDNDLLLAQLRGVHDRVQSVVLGDTYSINSNTLNSAHLTWSRLAIERGPAADMKNLPDFGVNMYAQSPNVTNLSITGYFNVGCGFCSESNFVNNAIQAADDVDLIRGRNHLSVGADWVHRQYNQIGGALNSGNVNFTGQFTNDALVDFMLGLDDSFQQGNTGYMNGRQDYLGFYFDDNLRLSKRLNLVFGLRWEPYLPVREQFNRIQFFNTAAYRAGATTSQYTDGPPGLFFVGDPGMPRGYTNSRLSEFEPRVGLTWDPTGSGRQTIRAGVGGFEEQMPTAYFQDQTADAPWGSTITLTAPVGGLTNPWQGYPGGNPFPQSQPPPKDFAFPQEGTYTFYPLNAHPTYVDQWNLSYQLQLTSNWLISANYLGNKTSHIWTGYQLNPGVYIPGTCGGSPCSTEDNLQQRRLLSQINPVAGILYGTIGQADDGANGEYQGLLLSAQHRLAKHYTIVANETWSHCISEGDFEGDLNTGQGYTQNPYNRNADRGNCGFDQRHNVNLTLVAEMPQFANPWTNRLIGNWQIAPLLSYHTGNWYSVFTAVDNSLTGVGNDRANALGGNPYLRNMSTLQWLNPNAFAQNAIGTFGNSGSDSLQGPSYFDIDAGVTRYFKISEHQRVELRFEFFNILNHPNFQVPDGTETDATFGAILSDFSPRILQFAMKYTF
ncbi:MAG: carboxypeptidase regulatory-like domain-containing protein [Terriglobia bacterium]|jgi:hypothetical protein